jgi:hypothetical protein
MIDRWGTFAFLWLTGRKRPGKNCRQGPDLPARRPPKGDGKIGFMTQYQYVAKTKGHGTALA